MHRSSRIYAAWATSLSSKLATLLVQVVSIPAAYRALGPQSFAAYAAVTSIVSVLGFFNLGLGGAMVSELGRAAAIGDRRRELQVLSSALVPLLVVAAAIALVALPTLAIVPMPLLFGEAAKGVSSSTLRVAVLLACMGTLASVPLSACGNARQAYQELHVSNTIATITNLAMFIGILLVAWLVPSLVAFVAIRVTIPVLGQLADSVLLVRSRSYLARSMASFSLARSKRLVADGLFFLAATSSYMLLYQWSVYVFARTRSADDTSRFAICIQLIVIAISFTVGLAQPLWGATANAVAARDVTWLRVTVNRVRLASIGYGIAVGLIFGFGLNSIVGVWLHQSLNFSVTEKWLAGGYVLLAVWEYAHWMLSLGLGLMRAASRVILCRAVIFSLLVPWTVQYGVTGVLCLLGASIVLTTFWYYPRLVSRALVAC